MGEALFAEWLAWMEREAVGGAYDDYRVQFQLAVMANLLVGGKGHGGQKEPWQPRDFALPWRAQPAPPPAPDRILSPTETRATLSALLSPLLGAPTPGRG